MNIGGALKTRIHEAVVLTRRHLATYRALFKKAGRATGEERARLMAKMGRVRAAWKLQLRKSCALHQILADYATDGWGDRRGG